MPGFVIELRSKVSGKKLALGKDGLVNCSGDGGATCKFVPEHVYSKTPFLYSRPHSWWKCTDNRIIGYYLLAICNISIGFVVKM